MKDDNFIQKFKFLGYKNTNGIHWFYGYCYCVYAIFLMMKRTK